MLRSDARKPTLFYKQLVVVDDLAAPISQSKRALGPAWAPLLLESIRLFLYIHLYRYLYQTGLLDLVAPPKPSDFEFNLRFLFYLAIWAGQTIGQSIWDNNKEKKKKPAQGSNRTRESANQLKGGGCFVI